MNVQIVNSVSRERDCSLLVFIVLFFTSSFTNAIGLIPITISLPVWIGVCLWAIYKKHSMNKRIILAFCLIISLYILSSIFAGNEIFRAIKFILPLTAVTLIINAYSLLEIKRAYVKCMVVLAGISLVMFALMAFPSAFFNRFIQPTNTARVYYNLYLFVHCIGSFRNCGMFWEPGAFSPFLLLALAIMFIEKDEKIRSRFSLKLIILLSALITTFSTNGYISLVLCIAMLIFDKGGSNSKRLGTGFLVIVVICLGLYFFSDNIFAAGGNNTFGKLYEIFSDSNYLNESNLNSSSIRLHSVLKPLEVCMDHPLFGVGYSKLQELTLTSTKGAITCTFSNWFGMYGMLYGCIMLGGYISFARNNGTSSINRVLLFVLLMLCIVSEDFSNNAFFTGIAIIGLSNYGTKQKNERNINENGKIAL